MAATSRRRWLVLLPFLVCPGTCCLGGILWFQNSVGGVANSLEAELSRARRIGMPTTPDDLRPKPPVAAEENAATIYRKFGTGREPTEDEKRRMDAVRATLSGKAKAAEKALARQTLRERRDLIAQVEKAADRPRADFGRRWEQGFRLPLPEYASMRRWIQLLCLKAKEQSGAGQGMKALRTLERAQRIAQHAGQDPTILGMLVHTAGEAIVHRTLLDVLKRASRNGPFLARAHQTLRAFGPLPDLRRAMGGEAVLGRVTVRQVEGFSDFDMSGTPQAEPNAFEKALFRSRTVQNAFDAKLVAVYRRLFERLPKNPEDLSATRAAVARTVYEVQNDDSLAGIMNKILLFTDEGIIDAAVSTVARRRLATVSLRLLEHRLGHTSLPARLPDFGAVSTDPFSGKPFAYLRVGQGFHLRSIGPERQDNSGVRKRKPIVVEIP